jgi:hypothetical protein
MQSLFDPNGSPGEVKPSASPVLRLIVFLLLAILGIGGWGVYRYEEELGRQERERCDKAHAEFLNSMSSDIPNNTVGIKEACGTDRLTSEETAEISRRKAAAEKSNREYECENALQQYGLESEVTKQHCPGTEVGKRAGINAK